MPYRREEATFLRKSATIRYYCCSIHLQTVVVMEAKWLMLNNTPVKLETAGFQTLPASRMATVENRKIVLLRHSINGIEEREEVLLCVNVLLAVSA